MKRIVLSLVVAAAIALSGCVVLKDETVPTEGLLMADDLQFADIPAPHAFKLLKSESFTFVSPEYRGGELVYNGRSTLAAVQAFYRDQMPVSDWQFIRQLDLDSKSAMYFKKNDERCVIHIEQRHRTVRLGITLQ